jgi:hypothetical protein
MIDRRKNIKQGVWIPGLRQGAHPGMTIEVAV